MLAVLNLKTFAAITVVDGHDKGTHESKQRMVKVRRGSAGV